MAYFEHSTNIFHSKIKPLGNNNHNIYENHQFVQQYNINGINQRSTPNIKEQRSTLTYLRMYVQRGVKCQRGTPKTS